MLARSREVRAVHRIGLGTLLTGNAHIHITDLYVLKFSTRAAETTI